MNSEPPPIEVRRSNRRKRTISAYMQGGTMVVVIPGHFTKAEEAEWVANMAARLAQREAKRRPSDQALLARSQELSRIYLAGAAQPASVNWSHQQNRRWGSCTIQSRAIRISSRIQGMPEYVLDYVLLHELTHLLHADHGPGFWSLLSGYPHLERARGFLAGVAHQLGHDVDAPDVDAPDVNAHDVDSPAEAEPKP